MNTAGSLSLEEISDQMQGRACEELQMLIVMFLGWIHGSTGSQCTVDESAGVWHV